MTLAEHWEPLAALPPPVAGFAGWVLRNATRETVPLPELQEHTAALFRAVRQVSACSRPAWSRRCALLQPCLLAGMQESLLDGCQHTVPLDC